MEHTPDTCPNKRLIEDISYDLKKVKDMYHDLDKKTNKDIEVIKEQNNTIISMLTNQSNDYKELFKSFTELDKKFLVNEYQTNRNTSLADKVTWGLIAKIGTLITVLATLFTALYKGA